MSRIFIPSTRQQQKTIYAFINAYANYLQSRSQKAIPSDYWRYKAKCDLKKKYIKATKEIREKEPLETMRNNILIKLNEVLDKNYTKETKTDILLNDIEYEVRDFIEDLAIQLGGSDTFSLALRVTSKTKAMSFITYLIDLFLDNEIPMGKELHDLVIESEHNKFIYACLKNKKCAICGNGKVDLHHWDSVASLGGAKQDKGQGRYISLCRLHHNEFHNVEAIEFYKKYKKKGIELSEDNIKELKKIYKNHFKGVGKSETR